MRAAVVAAVAAASLAVAAPAAAGRGAAARGPVGGPMLGSDGVVAAPLADAPRLPSGLSAKAWVVADADTGAVLAARAPHRRLLPASTLKALTAVTLLPLLDPARQVRASYDDAAVDGSKVGLVPGMRYRVDTLFTAMLVVSGNDAAGALAEAVGGIPTAVALMNDEAHRLQAFDTLARTPSGLDAPGETTSAYDLALIGRAGLAMPEFRHYVSVVRSNVPAPHRKHFQIYTHNRLLTSYRGAIGVKNGYTVRAGATYVGAATRGGHTLIVTLMGARPDFWPEARRLLDWGFAARTRVVPVGVLVSPQDPQEAAPSGSASSDVRPVVALPGRGGSDRVETWEIVALAVSSAAAVTATTRRARRRRSRPALPRL